MVYTRVMCASMHVLLAVRKFLLCAIAFASGKLRVVLKIADQSLAKISAVSRKLVQPKRTIKQNVLRGKMSISTSG